MHSDYINRENPYVVQVLSLQVISIAYPDRKCQAFYLEIYICFKIIKSSPSFFENLFFYFNKSALSWVDFLLSLFKNCELF